MAMAGISGGLRNTYTAGQQGARGLGMWNQQMKAMGTTLRYAAAGAVIFGAAGLVRNLSQLQQQMGMVEAIGDGVVKGGVNVNRMQQQMIKGSVDAIQPLADYQDAVINLLSSVSDAPQDQITPIITRISQTAKLSMTDITDLTKSIITMDNSFGQANNLQNVNKMTQMWFSLIKRVPGGAAVGPQIIGQLPTSASMARSANVSPGGLFALYSGLLRFGFTPTQVGPSVNRLLQTLAFPSTNVKTSRLALGQALGTDDPTGQANLIQKNGGIWAISRILAHARSLGISGDLGKARQLAKNAPSDLVDAGSIKDLGLSGAGVTYLGSVFHRVQGLRAIVGLLTRTLPGIPTAETLQSDLKDFTDIQGGVVSDTENLAKEWKKFARRSRLAEAATAIQGMSATIATTLAPLFNLAAYPLSKGARAVIDHPALAKGLSYGTAALLGAIGINKVTGGGIGSILKRVGLGRLVGGGFGQTALSLKAAEDAAKGIANPMLGASPQNPIYVIVVGQLLNTSSKGNLSGGGSPANKVEENLAGKITKNVGGSALSRLFGLGVGGAAVAGLVLSLGGDQGTASHQRRLARGKIHVGTSRTGGSIFYDPKKGFVVEEGESGWQKIHGEGKFGNEISTAKLLGTSFQRVRAIEKAAANGDIAKLLKDNNNQLVAAIEGTNQNLTIDLTVVQGDKTVARKKVHINPSTFSAQGGKIPRSRGKTKTMKANVSIP